MSRELLVIHLLGQEFLDDRSLQQFHIGQVLTLLVDVNLCTLFALFGHAHKHLEGILVTDLPVVARSRLDEQEFGFDAPEGLEATLVMGFHRLLDAIVDLIKDCHSHYLLFLCFS